MRFKIQSYQSFQEDFSYFLDLKDADMCCSRKKSVFLETKEGVIIALFGTVSYEDFWEL